MSTNEDPWSLIAEPNRRLIIEALAVRPQAVGELAAAFPITRSAVSQHLKVLKDYGLVSEVPSGTRRLYRLNPEAALAMRDQLDTFWSRTLRNFSEGEDKPHRGEP